MDSSDRERQAAELTLLTTMYPTEFSWRSDPPLDLSTTDFTDPVFALTLDRTAHLSIANSPPDILPFQ